MIKHVKGKKEFIEEVEAALNRPEDTHICLERAVGEITHINILGVDSITATLNRKEPVKFDRGSVSKEKYWNRCREIRKMRDEKKLAQRRLDNPKRIVNKFKRLAAKYYAA